MQCNREAPAVAEALDTFGEAIRFVGVAAQDGDDAMRDFRDRHGLGDMTTVVDDDGSLWAHLGVRVQPAWVFVDADGEVERVLGELSRDQLFARLAALADGGDPTGGAG
ncbi:redoxin domain-containing protein [Egicoccus sp. AB-alg2]|uniref:redoxin domain-containing protein n=1 Tax=Egicoccus sp. AB-alg2 TaxID=3242693 RepID=UPI00359CC0F3